MSGLEIECGQKGGLGGWGQGSGQGSGLGFILSRRKE
jgi:hypothetical protein